MAPRLRPLLTPPNDGTQKENKLDLRVALKTGAGHSDHIEQVTLCIEVLFGLCWRDVSDRPKQAPVVEPINPAKGGHFQILHVAPRALAVDQLGFVKTVNGFCESVIIRVPDAAGRWLDAGFGQTLGVTNGQILPAAIRMMNQSALLDRPSVMQGLLQSIENKVRFGGP